MKLYKFIFRTTDGKTANEVTGFAFEENAGEVFEHLVYAHLGKDEKYVGIVVPAMVQHELMYPSASIEIVSDHKIPMELYNEEICDNNIFIGHTEEELKHDGDCVYVCNVGSYYTNYPVDTRTYPQHIRYKELHPVTDSDYDSRPGHS